MRLIENIKKFILNAKLNKTFVFNSSDIPVNIKNYLIKEDMLYSPIRGIYILKKSDNYSSEAVFEHKNSIISKLGGVLSGTSALAYYRGKFNEITRYKIITKSKNFITYIGEGKKIEVVFTASKVTRDTKNIQIEHNNFEIETLLSLVMNDFKIIHNNTEIHKLLLKEDISEKKIETYIKDGFKISGISKLALFYQDNGFNDKYNIIKRVLDKNNKRLDTRGTGGVKKQQTKVIKKEKIDLNSLL